MENSIISVSELNALINQTLSFAYPEVVVEGEVSSFKVSQNKWVFFDLKDQNSVVGCFIPIFQLKKPIEDGMLVRVKALPQLTQWGKFSLTVKEIELAGEGSLKRGLEILKAKFEKEGLFDPSRKRPLPEFPRRILLVTSKQAAAFNDFVTVLNDRFGGIEIDHYQVQVQGEKAPGQLVRAIEFGSASDNYEVIVVIRGGGSLEDLQAFNDEAVVRAIYASRVPTLVGIGHEDDISLAELAADVRAATPTDAARRLVIDKSELIQSIKSSLDSMKITLNQRINHDKQVLSDYYYVLENKVVGMRHSLAEIASRVENGMVKIFESALSRLNTQSKLLSTLDPNSVLARGFSIARVNGNILKDATNYDGSSDVVLQLHRGSINLKPIKDVKKGNGQTEIRF